MNVYYLPSSRPGTDTPALALTASRWSVLRARTARLWWRLRFTSSEVWSVVVRGGRNPLEDHVWFADDAPVAPRRRTGPARILDLEAGRRRRVVAVARAAVAAASA
jgi:hypothetical protein